MKIKEILSLFGVLLLLSEATLANATSDESNAKTCGSDHFEVCKISVADDRVILFGSCSLSVNSGIRAKRVSKEIQSISCASQAVQLCNPSTDSNCAMAWGTMRDCNDAYQETKDFALAIKSTSSPSCGKIITNRRMEKSLRSLKSLEAKEFLTEKVSGSLIRSL